MTLKEFLHPTQTGGRVDQVLGVLLYHKEFAGTLLMSPPAIRTALVQARVPKARGINVHQALIRAGRYANQPTAGGPWEITTSGEDYLTAKYDIPRASSGRSHHPEVAVTALRRLAQRISDANTRDYVDEALTCLEAGARRAAVVFLWSGVIATIREGVWTEGARNIERALQTHNPRAKFTKKNDFDRVKDSDLLQAAQDLSVYDKSQKRHLGDALDLRNDCGHPVKYKPGQKKVESFIEDVIGIVWPEA